MSCSILIWLVALTAKKHSQITQTLSTWGDGPKKRTGKRFKWFPKDLEACRGPKSRFDVDYFCTDSKAIRLIMVDFNICLTYDIGTG